MKRFKYLGLIMTPSLTKDTGIEARIKRAKSQMGILRHFFSCKDIELHGKYFWVYIAGPSMFYSGAPNPAFFFLDCFIVCKRPLQVQWSIQKQKQGIDAKLTISGLLIAHKNGKLSFNPPSKGKKVPFLFRIAPFAV